METNTEVNTFVVGNTNTTTNKNNRNRNWFITINNPQIEDYEALKNIGTHIARYLIYQVEKVETVHIHACIVFENPRQWPKEFFPGAHIEMVKNLKKCIAYCSKTETRIQNPIEYGIRPEQGRRTDLEEAAESILEHRSLTEVVNNRPDQYIRYHRGMQAYLTTIMTHRDKAPIVYWFWGSAGTGKTRCAYNLFNGDCYMKDGTQWWDGYKQQKAIIIDDFDGKWPFRDLLRLLDIYPYQGQTKGGYVPINSDYIIITCEHHPMEFWNDNEFAQINRRLTWKMQVMPGSYEKLYEHCKGEIDAMDRFFVEEDD